MNLGITIARKGQTFEVLVGPEVSFNEQRRNFRKLRAGLVDFDEVQLWSSGQGRVKRYRFKSKVQHVVPPADEKKDAVASEPAAPAPIEINTSSADVPSKKSKSAGKKR